MEHAAVTRDAVIARNVSPRKRGTLSNPRFRLVPMLHISTFPTSANDSKPWSVNLQRLVDASLRDHAMSPERALKDSCSMHGSRCRDERRADLHADPSSLDTLLYIFSVLAESTEDERLVTLAGCHAFTVHLLYGSDRTMETYTSSTYVTASKPPQHY